MQTEGSSVPRHQMATVDDRDASSRGATVTERVRLLIVDDDRAAVTDLQRRLTASEMDVVGSTNDGDHAIDLARVLRPDVALIDWDMPHFGGALTARLMRRYAPAVTTLLMIDEDDRAEVRGTSFTSMTVAKASSAADIRATIARVRSDADARSH